MYITVWMQMRLMVMWSNICSNTGNCIRLNHICGARRLWTNCGHSAILMRLIWIAAKTCKQCNTYSRILLSWLIFVSFFFWWRWCFYGNWFSNTENVPHVVRPENFKKPAYGKRSIFPSEYCKKNCLSPKRRIRLILVCMFFFC